MSGILPSYDVLSQRNVTRLFVLIDVIKNDDAVLLMK